MKLNKTEISALADKMISDLQTDINESLIQKMVDDFNSKWDSFLRGEDYPVFTFYGFDVKTSKVFEKVLPNIEKDGVLFSASNLHNGKQAVTNFGKIYYKKSATIPSKSQIEREIILAQIGTNDLATIMDTVRKSLGLGE